jgi:hypothetical protein
VAKAKLAALRFAPLILRIRDDPLKQPSLLTLRCEGRVRKKNLQCVLTGHDVQVV